MKIHYNKGAKRVISKNVVHSLISPKAMRFSDRDYITVYVQIYDFNFYGFCKDLRLKR
jgi:hypothetical protein